MMPDTNNLTELDIRNRLIHVPDQPPHNPYPLNYFNRPRKRAAVLIPFTKIDQAWHLLFIRRTKHENDHHGGQVAFPGGGQEEQDFDIYSTALREAHEEVGLNPDDVRLLGQLEDVISISNYHVTPVVGAFTFPYLFKPDPNEVDHIFTVPLDWLAEPNNRVIKYRKVDEHDPWPVIYFNEFHGETVWGFTAALIIRLIDLLS